MSPEMAARLRMDAPIMIVGLIVGIIGIAALLMHVLRGGRAGRLLLWFSAFSILYGTRIVVASVFVSEVFGVTAGLRRWTDALITYTINIPSALLVRELVGEGWRRSLTWLLRVQIAFAVCGIASDLAQGRPKTLSLLNSLLVIASMAVFVGNSVRANLSAIPGIQVLMAGLAAFIIAVVDENVARRSSRGLWLEPAGFLVFVCCLAYVIGRVVTSSAAHLAAIQHELETARQIQASIMPQQMPRISGLDIAVRYRPMSEVAGDFYDFIPIDEQRLGVLVADVSGHGVPAALVASMVKVALAAQAPHADDPARVLAGLNRVLAPHLSGQFVTAAYICVDANLRVLTYSGAAHPAILIARTGGVMEEIEKNGLMIGPFSFASYENATVQLSTGDLVLIYTDGITEAVNHADEDFGAERLRSALEANGSRGANQIADALLDAVTHWSPGPQQDDRTLVVIDVVDTEFAAQV
jgi:sigma-B regulation protein RsbU (phosphoserine phosphatase)